MNNLQQLKEYPAEINEESCNNAKNYNITSANDCDCAPPEPVSILKPGRLVSYIVGAVLFLVGLLLSPDGYVALAIFGSAYLIFGGPVLLRAARNIAAGKIFDENFLMAIATLGAFAIGEYPEGVAVMVFYQAGETLQDSAVGRSRRSIEQLMDIRPEYANLQEGGKTRKVLPELVSPGSKILVRPGERIPLDGIVIEGMSALDLSALTGESIPREVETGAEVMSGSVNKTGLLTLKVTKKYSDSTVSRILALVQNASTRKARTEQFITRFAAYYTPAVVFIALGIALFPPLLFSAEGFSTWAYRALVFLVISCPCALVISIPLGFFGGIGGASRKGILVKGGNYLEALSRVTTVIFDKTGTLTEGVFKVKEIKPAHGLKEEELLRYAAAAAYHSTHPLSLSVLQAAGDGVNASELKQYEELPGRGVKVHYENRPVLMGSRRLMLEEGISIEDESDGLTNIHLAVDGIYAGSIIAADNLKEDAKDAIQSLRELGVDRIVMLTGDRQEVADAIGAKLGLDGVYAGLLPHEKVALIEKLEEEKSSGERHVFVGDGINDAPSLARAEIGVAMGGVASDAAIEAADIVLMTGQPSKLGEAVQVARKTRSIVVQNIVLALGIKAVIMGFGLFGLATMWGAVFADVGVALLAVLNAMRALK